MKGWCGIFSVVFSLDRRGPVPVNMLSMMSPGNKIRIASLLRICATLFCVTSFRKAVKDNSKVLVVLYQQEAMTSSAKLNEPDGIMS